MPGNYLADVSKIHLTNNNNSSNTITGTISLNPFNDNVVNVNWDSDSFPQDTVIDGRTSIDYIIDPTNFDPTGIKTSGVRLLLGR